MCLQFSISVFEGTCVLFGPVENSVEGRPGFDDDQKQRMLLSATTENGIRITGVCVCVRVCVCVCVCVCVIMLIL